MVKLPIYSRLSNTGADLSSKEVKLVGLVTYMCERAIPTSILFILATSCEHDIIVR